MADTHVYARRLAALRCRLADAVESGPLDGLLVTDAHNRRYVSGFTGSTGFLLVTPTAAVLLADFRYVEQATAQAPICQVVQYEYPPWPAIAAQAPALGIGRLGFEAESVTVADHERLQAALRAAAPGVEALPVEGAVEALRRAKDTAEVDLIRRAVQVADRALEAVAASLIPGVTERQVAWQLEVALRERGAEGLAFPTIVAAGPNAALPHHRTSERPIGHGEPIIVDMGCVLEGYCSDVSRTFVLGEPDARFWEIYTLVLRAQQACEDGVRAGRRGKEADALARDLIAHAGYGASFGHGTGHGVGLAAHEDPYLSRTRGDAPLGEGAVVTVEPGIYLSGWGGVRIEDVVVVGPTRCQVLTTAHKFPVIDLAH